MMAVLPLTACSEIESDGVAPPAGLHKLSVVMSAEQMVPASGSSRELTAEVVADENALTLEINVDVSGFSELETITLRTGFAGSNGSAVDELSASNTPNIWTLKYEEGDFSQESINKLLAGQYYLKLVTGEYQDGELRGQILTSNLRLDIFSMSNLLVTPTGTDSSLKGTGYATINESDTSLVLYSWVDETGTDFSARLYQGAINTDGRLIQELDSVIGNDSAWQLEYSLEADEWTAINNGHLYLQMHSSVYPRGEIRGQIGAK